MNQLLSKEQKENFEKRLVALGLTQADVVPAAKADTPLTPKMITIPNVDEFKRLFGIPDSDYDSGKMKHHHDPLPPWDSAKNNLTPKDMPGEDRQNIEKALKAYILGDSKKYAGYKPAIEKMHFPMEIAAYAADDLTVHSGETYNVPPGTHAYGIITIYKNGTLSFGGDSNIDTQQMIYLDQQG